MCNFSLDKNRIFDMSAFLKQLQQLRDIKAVQQQETDEAAKPKQQSPTEKKTST